MQVLPSIGFPCKGQFGSCSSALDDNLPQLLGNPDKIPQPLPFSELEKEPSVPVVLEHFRGRRRRAPLRGHSHYNGLFGQRYYYEPQHVIVIPQQRPNIIPILLVILIVLIMIILQKNKSG